MRTIKEESNIVQFKKSKQLNIGIIIFGIIFVYLVATVVLYITAPRTSVYEVRQGSILKDNAYTGLALRDELVVEAESSGYINYYAQEASKVKVGSNIYTLSSSEINFTNTVVDDSLEVSKELEKSIIQKIQSYNKNFHNNTFDNTYTLKSEIEKKLGDLSSDSKMAQLNALMHDASSNIEVYRTKDDGIVVYSIDGMEGLTKETVTVQHLDKTNYKKEQHANNSQVKSGDEVYKIITSDRWKLLLELTDETAEILAEKSYVKVKFLKDNQTIWADFKMENVQGHNIATLSFQDSMVRYATERYLDVELIIEDETGLKIPKTAETEKEFYVVPKSYVTQGGNSKGSAILTETKNSSGETITQLKDVTIYYEEDEWVYLDPNQVGEISVIKMTESNETYTISGTKTLKGVFCINKGYAVFKQIHILCESDSYYIVEEGNAYGLSNYDHIALDSTGIKENDVVF